MNKKLISALLALSVCFGMAGCEAVDKSKNWLDSVTDNTFMENWFDQDKGSVDDSSSTSEAPEAPVSDLEGAKVALDAQQKTQNVSTRNDYTLMNTIAYDGIVYTITWTVDVTTGVVAKAQEDNTTLIDIDQALAEDLAYVLTATIADKDGNSIQTSYNRTALAAAALVPAPITEKPVEGTAYKYHVYQSTLKKDLYFSAKMDGYYFGTTEDIEKAVELYVEYVEGSEEEFNIYFLNEDGSKTYIGVRQNGTHNNVLMEATPVSTFKYVEEYKTVITNIPVDNKATDFYLGNYSTHDTISASKISYFGGEGNNVGALVGMVERDSVADDVKVTETVKEVKLANAYVANGSIDLPTQGNMFPDVKIAWTVEGAGATVADGKLSFAAIEATGDITLTATYTLNEETVSKSYTTTLVKNDAASIVAAAYELAENESFGNKATLEGIVIDVKEAYNSQYENVTVTLYTQDQKIDCYRLKGDGASQLAKGYTITVTGTLTNYKGTVQFGAGCLIDSFVVGDESNLPDLGEDENPDTPDTPDVPVGETTTISLNVTNLNVPDAYSTENTTATVDGVEFTFVQVANYGNGLQWRTKNGVSGSLWNSTALDGKLAQIVLTPNQTKMGDHSNEYTLALGNTAECNEKTMTVSTNGKNTVTISIDGSYTYFKLTHANTYTQYFDAIDVVIAEADPTYTLVLRDGNPMMGGTMEEVQYAEGATLNLPTPTKDGKTFKGWFAMDDNGEPTVAAPATMPAEAVALYAVWEVTPYTLTIKQDGAEDKTFTFAVEYTNNILISVNDLAYVLADNLPEGYTWAEAIPNAWELKDYTFNAVLAETPKYVFTVITGNPRLDPTCVTTSELVEGAELSLTAPTAEGKNFLGWIDVEGNPAATTMPAEDYAVYASWEIIPYTVTIKQSGAEDQTFTFGVDASMGEVDVPVEGVASNLASYLPAASEEATYAWAETLPETWELKDYTFTVKTTYLNKTFAELNAIGSNMAHDTYTTDLYYAIGLVSKVESTTFGNIYLTDLNGDILYSYGLFTTDGVRYDKMTTKPVVGDYIKVVSTVGCYSNAPQMKNATLVEIIAPENVPAEYKALATSWELDVAGRITEDVAVTLPVAGVKYADVAITWASSDEAIAAVNGGVITFTRPAQETTVTLTATLSVGQTTKTLTYDVLVTAAGVVAKQEVTVEANFSTLAAGTQYADESYTFGENLTVSSHNKGCHFNTQLRIYDSASNNGWAILTCKGVVTSLAINMGYKAATMDVYGSVDGTTWTKITSIATSTSYKDYNTTISEESGYKYIKLDASGAQIRVANLSVTMLL